MKKIFAILLSFLLFFLVTSHSSAFQEPPYIVIQKPTPINSVIVANNSEFSSALVAAGPGTLIQMRAGVYDAVNISSSGAADNEIVIEPYGDGTVYIEVSGDGNTWSWYGNYVILDGGSERQIVLRKKASTTYVASLVRLRGDNQTLSRILLQGPIGSCSTPTNTLISPNNGGSVPGRPSNYRIFNNILDSHSHKGIYAAGTINGEIRNNIIRGGEGHSIQFNPHDGMSNVDGAVIAGNLIINNTTCTITSKNSTGIYIDGDNRRGGTVANVTIADNIIANNAGNGINLLSDSTDLIGAEYIYHNTIYNNGGNGIDIDNNMPGSLVHLYNNILFSNTVNIRDQTGNINQGSNLTIDPVFQSTSQSSNLYMMLSSSSTDAIDQGIDLRTVTGVDYFGKRRDSTPDLGAHEYNGTDLVDCESSGFYCCQSGYTCANDQPGACSSGTCCNSTSDCVSIQNFILQIIPPVISAPEESRRRRLGGSF